MKSFKRVAIENYTRYERNKNKENINNDLDFDVDVDVKSLFAKIFSNNNILDGDNFNNTHF